MTEGYDIAVDGAGQAYVTGDTQSADFPASLGPGYDTSYNGGCSDAFAVKLVTLPIGSVTAPRAGVRPIVDGDLQEWNGLDATFLDYTTAATIVGDVPTPADLSLRLRAAWAPEALYFGVTVWDDVLVGNDSPNIWEDDDLELGLYVPAAGRSHQFSFSVDGRITDQGVPISSLTAVTRTVPGGWNLEVMVPVAVLGSGALAADQQYPFTFGYWDDDLGHGAMGQTHMIWQGDSTFAYQPAWGTLELSSSVHDYLQPTPDCHRHQHAIAHRHCDAHPDADAHGHSDRDPYSNTHRHSDTDGDRHADSHGNGHLHADPDGHTYPRPPRRQPPRRRHQLLRLRLRRRPPPPSPPRRRTARSAASPGMTPTATACAPPASPA